MNRSRWRGVWGHLRKVLAACAIVSSVPALPQTRDVPQPWIAYAQLVGRQFHAWLEADNDAADRLHQYLEERILNAQADAPPPAIVIRAWIGANGSITNVEFDSLGDAKADATLRQLLTQHPMSETPPPDMLQPLRVRLRLTPNPEAPADASAALPAQAR
ncbi:YbaB/EbfC family DNA-binding protein [Trinickia symbiotica]|uniref:YbaB/EbfC family DNA-binding protein n=1 Tax=Trinickia symbiotica TaxID=863227 RepID=UPI0026AAFE1A